MPWLTLFQFTISWQQFNTLYIFAYNIWAYHIFGTVILSDYCSVICRFWTKDRGRGVYGYFYSAILSMWIEVTLKVYIIYTGSKLACCAGHILGCCCVKLCILTRGSLVMGLFLLTIIISFFEECSYWSICHHDH